MSLFQMVLLDVLIIGGGPHALTLASLLTTTKPNANWKPGHDLAQCALCSAPQPTREQSDNKFTSQKKKKKKAATGRDSFVDLRQLPAVVFSLNFFPDFN